MKHEHVGKFSMGYCCAGGEHGEKHAPGCRYRPVTMNEQDDQAKQDWLKWELDSLQHEWDAQQQVHEAREHTSPNATTHVDAGRVARLSSYETGIVAPDGYREKVQVELCQACDREAEYGGYCEEHWDDRLEEIAEQEMLEHDEWVEDAYSREELERIQAMEQERRDDH